MAERVTFSKSSPPREYLIAYRSGKVCCPVCDSNNPDCFSREGLHQHYRMVHKQAEFNEEFVSEGATLLRRYAALETLSNLLTLSEKRRKMGCELYNSYTIEGGNETVELYCASDREAAKLFGLYLDHKISLPKVEDCGEGINVQVRSILVTCTYKLWRARDKIFAEAVYFQSKTPVTSFPAPQDSVLKITCESPIELHMSFPESVEDYTQEIGRAGRDGLPARCTLFFDHGDRSFHLHNIMQIDDKEYATYKYELMNHMVRYCQNVACRHKFIMSYFDENILECEEHCDICTSNIANTIQDCTSISCLIVQGLQRLQQVHEKVTVLLLTQFLIGSSTTVLKSLMLDTAAEFGSVKVYYKAKRGRKQLQGLIYHLIITGIIKEVPSGTSERPSIMLTTGNIQQLMDGDEKVWFSHNI